jgi:hypothetical protein
MSRSSDAGRRAWMTRQRELLVVGRDKYGARVDELVAEDLADEDLCRLLAEWVTCYRREHGTGPTWRELAEQARPDVCNDVDPAGGDLPCRVYADALVLALARAKWVRYGRGRGSLRAGPRLRQDAAQS